MPRFSDRFGHRPSVPLQVEFFTEKQRGMLWTVVSDSFPKTSDKAWRALEAEMCREVFDTPSDTALRDYYVHNYHALRKQFFTCKWYEVLDLIEVFMNVFRALHPQSRLTKTQLQEKFNAALEKGNSAYRLSGFQAVPISDSVEMTAYEEAIKQSEDSGLLGVRRHLQRSAALLTDGDYRNSIKESISAVESATKTISGTSSGGLSSALANLNNQVPMHGALKRSLLGLYGWTSDDQGIRHSLLDEPTVGFDEAKFMLVSCTAFTNYLLSRSRAAQQSPS